MDKENEQAKRDLILFVQKRKNEIIKDSDDENKIIEELYKMNEKKITSLLIA